MKEKNLPKTLLNNRPGFSCKTYFQAKLSLSFSSEKFNYLIVTFRDKYDYKTIFFCDKKGKGFQVKAPKFLLKNLLMNIYIYE